MPTRRPVKGRTHAGDDAGDVGSADAGVGEGLGEERADHLGMPAAVLGVAGREGHAGGRVDDGDGGPGGGVDREQHPSIVGGCDGPDRRSGYSNRTVPVVEASDASWR